MRGGLRQSMAWLHSWAGLLAGWILFFMFVTGTLGYLSKEIDHWMQPEEPLLSQARPTSDLLPLAMSYLETHAPDAQSWSITFPASRGNHDLIAAWRAQPEGDQKAGKLIRDRLDQNTGQKIDLQTRETGGGAALYRMHYALHYMPFNWAVRIVGACTMFMLVAIVSGIITHKKIFADIFTFRPGKGQRSWLDGHGLASVAALPFHLMITYSGLIFFMFNYMPVGPDMIFGDRDRFFQQAYGWESDEEKPAAAEAAMAPLAPLLSRADAIWGKEQVGSVHIDNPNLANAIVFVNRIPGSAITGAGNSLRFDGPTGKLIPEPEKPIRAAVVTADTMRALHVGSFANPALRFLYLLAGASGGVMIATGLTLWSTKRKAKLAKAGSSHFGIALVDRLNVGTILGLPIAIAAYFWSNRLLPVGMEHRAEWEVHSMFITWALMLIYPVWRSLEKAWAEMAWLAAGAFALIPILNAVTTNRHLGVSLPAGDYVLAGFDLSAFGVGLFFMWLARRLSRPKHQSRPLPKRRHDPATQMEPAE